MINKCQDGDVLEIEWLGFKEKVLVVNDVAGGNGYLIVDLSTMEVLTSVNQLLNIENELKIIKRLGRFHGLFSI